MSKKYIATCLTNKLTTRDCLIGLSIISISCLQVGCGRTANNPSTNHTTHTYCEQLQQQMAAAEADTQPGVQSSPTNQAMLLQRYRDYNCDTPNESGVNSAPPASGPSKAKHNGK